MLAEKLNLSDRQNIIFVYLLLIVLFVFYIPSFITEGMFFDGLTYSSISRNLSIDEGSIFSLKYTETLKTPFYEHPPIFFIVQSYYFKIIGDYYFTEKLFCFSFLVINLLLLILIVKSTTKELFKIEIDPRGKYHILLLLLCTPIIIWTYRNNLLEILVTTFTLLSILFFILSTFKGNSKLKNLFAVLFSVLSLFLAVGVKGLVASFPLIVPICIFLFLDKAQRSRISINIILFYSLIFIILYVLYYLILNNKELAIYYGEYVNNQLIKSLIGQREVTTDRLVIIKALAINIILPVVLTTLTLFKNIPLKSTKNSDFRRIALFFIVIGMAASLPILLSPKQRDFYIMPSIPFYILGLYFMFYSRFMLAFSYLANLRLFMFYRVILLASLIVPLSYFYFGMNRDHDLIEEVKKISKTYSNETICIDKEKFNDWRLHAYFHRYGQISLTDNCTQIGIVHFMTFHENDKIIKLNVLEYEK